jgi:hypothetical protein
MTDPGEATNPSPADDEVLLFETSPYGTLDAIVQHDGRVVYFYLGDSGRGQSDERPAGRFGMQACWVRNLVPGPYVLNEEEMKAGVAPLLPRTHCTSTEPGSLPRVDDLKIVWFEEGNGAALVEQQSDGQPATLAVIPPWAGMEGFHGYARDCAAESPLCWPMPANPNLQHRIDRAAKFWSSFSATPDPFTSLQSEILKAYGDHFVPATSSAMRPEDGALTNSENESTDESIAQPKYWAIDGGLFPPRGLAHYRTPQANILATVAMSLCPQPTVELFSQAPSQDRRIELAIQLPPDTSHDELENVAKRISSLAAYPWQQFSWFGHGHSCEFLNVLPDSAQALFVQDRVCHPQRSIEMPIFRGDPVKLLWLIPLNSNRKPLIQTGEFSVDQFLSPSGDPNSAA